MAFRVAAGYGNLPNGNFSPVIFSKKAQIAFRKASVVDAITNSDYFGEISQFGDTVGIMKEPDIAINDYSRGLEMETQNLVDEDFQLTIDKAKYFRFYEDDIEAKHAHHDWLALASNKAAYDLKDNYDQDVLGYMSGYKQTANGVVASTVNDVVSGTKAIDTAGSDELLTSMKLNKGSFGSITTASAGDHSIPLAIRLPGATTVPTATVSPNDVVRRMALKLNQQNVPSDGRFLVIDPTILEMLCDEDSRFLNADFGESGSLRNGLILNSWQGFKVYMSNNLPAVGGGPGTTGTANQNTDYGVIVAGHSSAVATAEQISKTRTKEADKSFGTNVDGLHLYGRKILRPESLVTAKYNVA